VFKIKKQRRRGQISIFRESVLSNLKNIENHMMRIRYSLPFRQKEEIVDSIFNNSFPGKKYLFRGIIANSINDISSTKYIPFYQEQDILFDIEWVTLILEKYIKELEYYYLLKEEYEVCIVNGNIEKANVLLDKINNEITYSFWGIEQTMICSEMLGGFESNRNKLSEIAEKTNKYLILMVSEFYSYKAEIDSTYSNFIHRLSNFFNQTSDEFDEILIKDYLDFQFKTIDTNLSTESMRRVLSLSTTLPLIDLYEDFVKASSIILSSNLYNDEAKRLIINSIESMDLKDKRLQNMLALYNPSKINNGYFIIEENRIVERVIELYTIGNYEECVSLINVKNLYGYNLFFNFDILNIYIKSLINLGLGITEVDNINEFLKKNVLVPIYNIYSCIDKEENLNKLINSAKVFGNISYRYKIESFYLSQINPPGKDRLRLYHLISNINSNSITPQAVLSFETIEEQIHFLGILKINNLFKQTTILMESHVNADFENNYLDHVPSARYNYYKGKALSNDNSVEVLKDILIGLKEMDDQNINYKMFEYERVATELFKVFLEKSEFEEAINIIVDSYLLNKSTVIRMDKVKLSELLSIEENQVVNIKRVIFEYIVDDKDHYKIYSTLINFLENSHLDIPSDLINWSTENTQHLEEIQFILSNIYTKEIMKYFVRINPKKRSEERIKVLNYLIASDTTADNHQKYNEEINNIMKAQSIQERIRSIDEKKIFVDTEAILKEFNDVFKEKYRRYIALKELRQELSFFDLNEATAKIEKFSQAAKLEFSESQEKKQRFLMYKEIIQDFSNEVLHNPKYGLAKFLSSRIRHGLLENNLSKTFKNYNLLSLKIDSEATEFIINNYWQEEFIKYNNEMSSQDIKIINNALGNFSKKVVSKIEEVKEWIRITDKNHKNGMFDYSTFYNESTLLVFYGSSSKNIDYKTFFDEIINFFWSMTEENLKVIRARINGELYKYFVECLDSLMSEVEEVKNSNILNEVVSLLLNNIHLCRTVLKNDLQQISNWFIVRRHGEYYDYSMHELISTCVEINKKTHKNYSMINSSENIQTDINLKGETFYYLVDIITILYSNAIEHSGFENFQEMNIQIEISEMESMEVAKIAEEIDSSNNNDADFIKSFKESNFSTLKIRVKNLLSEHKDVNKTYNRVDEIFGKIKNLDKYANLVSEEGGTGISKIYYTLKHNIDSLFVHQYYIDEDRYFNAEIYLNLKGLTASEEVKDEASIY
jgi:hypothetical protein